MKLVEVASIYGKDPIEMAKTKERGYMKLKRKGVIVLIRSANIVEDPLAQALVLGLFRSAGITEGPLAQALVLGLCLPLTLTIEDYAADDWETVTDD